MVISSTQLVAIARCVLAGVFLLAIYVDPTQPVAVPLQGYAILGIYVLLSMVVMVIALRNWWLDHRLAVPMHLIDLAMFGAVVFFTEGYTSPFFTFSVFLLLSASIRWTSRVTALTAATVCVLYFVAGMMSELTTPGAMDEQRLIIRSSYLLTLSAMFTLFAHNRDLNRANDWVPGAVPARLRMEDLMTRAGDLVRQRTAARDVILTWRDAEEPRSCIDRNSGAGWDRQWLPAAGIDHLLALPPDAPHLFDTAGCNLLTGADSIKTGTMRHDLAQALHQRGVEHGLAFAFSTGEIDCAVYASGIANLSTDMLATGSALLAQMRHLVEQASYNRLEQASAESDVRVRVARDLHDGVSQILAGVSFRLEALRRLSGSPEATMAGIAELQGQLGGEQRRLKEMIRELRDPPAPAQDSDAIDRLSALALDLSRQWNVACRLDAAPGMQVPSRVEKDLRQMIREGVANAVRHGRAGHVDVLLARDNAGLTLHIADDGSGFGMRGDSLPVMPRSLAERAAALGGSIAVEDGAGATVAITLPLRKDA